MNKFSTGTFTRALVLTLGGLLFGACADAPLNNDGFPVTDAGPFEVGYRRLETTYDPQDGSPARTIRVVVWYPAEDDAAFTSPEGLASTYLLTETHAYLNAPLRRAAYRDGYPVVVHSHGGNGYADQNYHVAEGLARHGFVVISPMHEGDTAFNIANGIRSVSTNYLRPMDISASLDLLESGLPAGDPLAGRCVTSRVILSGHSRGTQTGAALLGAQFNRAIFEAECANGDYASSGGCTVEQLARYDANYGDPRIIAALLAGGDGGASGFVGGGAAFDALTTPMLFMEGSEDGSLSGVMSLLPMLDGQDASLIVFEGGCHNMPAGGGCTNITNEEAWPVINDYYRAFARRHLFNDQSAAVTGILDGTVSLSTKVTVTP